MEEKGSKDEMPRESSLLSRNVRRTVLGLAVILVAAIAILLLIRYTLIP